VQSLIVKVWPAADKVPQHEGVLIDLDAVQDGQKFTAKTNDLATVRVQEITNGGKGYQWELPVVHEWKCAKVMDENLGGFNTGYKQWLYKATATTDCIENVIIKRAKWAMDEGKSAQITVQVIIAGTGDNAAKCQGGKMEGDKCVCPADTKLDDKTGNCVTTAVADMTMKIDAAMMNYRIGLSVGQKITLTEESADGKFAWAMPDEVINPKPTADDCVSVVSSKMDNTVRSVFLEAKKAECTFTLNRGPTTPDAAVVTQPK
jgi:hypothetical protein